MWVGTTEMTAKDIRKPTQPMVAGDLQQWGSDLVVASHEEALFAFGEWAMFTMMWRPIDFGLGLVEHCSTCYGDGSVVSADDRRAAAFSQPTKRECPDCYGTTYEGGYRAQVVRSSLLADRNVESTDEARGVVTIDTIQVETTTDFVLRKGDYIFRGDNSRFQVEEKNENVVRTGFISPTALNSFSGITTAHLEEHTSVAHLIPPTEADLHTILNQQGGFLVHGLPVPDYLAPNGYLVEPT